MRNLTLRLTYILLMVLALASNVFAQAQDKSDDDLKLGAGDSIHIVVFQNPDMTLDTRVSESGTITYPLIGAVTIGGLTIDAAEKKIAKSLRDGGFVQQPQVNIVVTQIRGSQVSVLGQVNRPGRFPIETQNTRVSDMLALAGGITPTGSDVVILTGVRDGKSFRKEIDVPSIFMGTTAPDDVVVRGGDMIYVHRAQVFYIYGEAQRPGPYRVERGMTVQQALAQGGGITPRGTEWRLRLDRRMPDGTVQRISPERSDLIQADDVLYVRESLF
jgi:polysaccharide export outer membrane protein